MTAASQPWWWLWSRQEKLLFRFSQKWVFTFPSCRNSFWKPQNLIENLYGPPFWTSSFISVTDSCSPHWGSRVTYDDRCLCSEVFVFTRRRGSKEQICYWWAVLCLLNFLYVYTFLFVLWICCTGRYLKSFVPKWFIYHFKKWIRTCSHLAAGTARRHIMI